jgi:hypothetical protein
MRRHMPLVVFLLACASYEVGAAGVELTPYFESSANQKPRGNAGLSLDADNIKVQADVALRAPNHETTIIPRLTSEVALSPHVGIETHVDFGEWSTGVGVPDAKFDTTLHFQSSTAFLDEFEGRFWRSPDGQTGRILGFGFYQKLGGSSPGRAVTIRSRATLETTNAPADLVAGAALDSRRVGVETEIRGLIPGRRARRRTALRLKVEKVRGAQAETASTVTYDRSWPVGLAQIGFNVQMQKATTTTSNAFEPSVGFRWRAQF